MTDHLTRATSVAKDDRADVFIVLANDVLGKGWRKLLADALESDIKRIYQLTTKGRITEFTLAYLLALIDLGYRGEGSKHTINPERMAELHAAYPDVFGHLKG